MPENQNVAVQIGRLNLRIPGMNANTAHQVARGVALGLAQGLPAGTHRHLGALSLRARVPASPTETEMSDAIAKAILRALRT